MTATATTVRPLAESRPPGATWPLIGLAPTLGNQPTLDFLPEPPSAPATVNRSRWCARQDPRLPDARTWSTSLALALVEALHAMRPIAQLNRWVDEEVVSAIFLATRRRRSTPDRASTPPVLRSVRLQHPHPRVAEVSAHVSIQGQSLALAFRLEGLGDRWLCTALELGPRS